MSDVKFNEDKIVFNIVDIVGEGIDLGLSFSGMPIPIYNLVKNLVLTGKSIYDQYVLKKLLLFISGVNYKNIKNKSYFDKFFEKKRLHDSKFWVKNGELLVDYINQTDDRRKAFLIGKVFSYCIEYEIDENIFFNLAFKINKSYYDDLNAISLFRDNKEIVSSQDALFNLCTYGFLRNLGYDGGSASEESASGSIYQLNNFGEILLEVFKKTDSL